MVTCGRVRNKLITANFSVGLHVKHYDYDIVLLYL